MSIILVYFVLLRLQEEADVSLNEPTLATRPVCEETKADGVTTIDDGYNQDLGNSSSAVGFDEREKTIHTMEVEVEEAGGEGEGGTVNG